MRISTLLRHCLKARWVVMSLLCLVGFPHSAQEECDDLTGDDLTVCLTLMVCMGLEDNKAQNQCLEVARQLLDKRDSQVEAEEPEASTAPEPVKEPEIQDEVEATIVDEPVVREEPQIEEDLSAESEEQSVVVDESAATEKRSFVGRLISPFRRGDRSKLDQTAVNEEPELTVDGVPKQFAATVIAKAKAGYNDELLVLSNGYVFLVSRAKQSRIDVDDVIVAKKKEGLSGRNAFFFYGRGATADATRVLCEHTQPSRKTRERCEYAARHLGENSP